MSDFSTGMVVRHSTLGIGKVVALEPTAVHVFFAEGERREAAKLRLPTARVYMQPDPKARDDRLDNLPPFALDPATGRYAPERPRATGPAKKARK